MSRSRFFKVSGCFAALMLVPVLVISADARPGGGGGGGGGRGGGGGGGGFRAAPMVHSAPMIRSVPHSFSTSHSVTRLGIPHGSVNHHVVRSGTVHTHVTHTNPANTTVKSSHSVNTKTATNTSGNNHNLVTRSVKGAGHASVLHNAAFASLSKHNHALANSTFKGKFAGKNWPNHNGGWYWHRHRPFIVIGWLGPLFWPWAYWDFVDYVYWPYAYDEFWPFAYDDLYWGWYGPYAYEGPAYANVSANTSSRRARRGAPRPVTTGEVCSEQVPTLTDWPVDQIAKTVEPKESQQDALNGLKDATGKAIGVLQAGCPTDLPSTPTGRLAAMRSRIETMLQAVDIVQPALERFYNSLDDEQKARFNAIAPDGQQARAGRGGGARRSDLAQVCGADAARATAVPTRRIEQALHPTDEQRSALDALDGATAKAAGLLETNCPADESITPPGRVAAMHARLGAMLDAIKTVQPALDTFYGTLTDEQKARFNQLGARS